jgi:hypothetical protein
LCVTDGGLFNKFFAQQRSTVASCLPAASRSATVAGLFLFGDDFPAGLLRQLAAKRTRLK